MSFPRFTARRASGPLLAAAALSTTWWLLASEEERVLYASVDPSSADIDQDGLIAHQEEVLGTTDDNPDTDGDLVDDLVELARGSDPLNAVSVPEPQLVNVGMTARSDDGIVTVVSAIYSCPAEFPGFSFTFGVSIGGSTFSLPASVFMPASTLTLYPITDPAGWIVVLETKIPEALLQAYGYLGFYTIVSPAGAMTAQSAAVLNLFDFGGSSVHLLPAPPDYSGGGSIYKPLPRGEDLPASAWTDMEVCWQSTSAVGTDGSSVILDIEDASCIPMTTKCHASSCQAGIGTTVKVLDAGALAGGG